MFKVKGKYDDSLNIERERIIMKKATRITSQSYYRAGKGEKQWFIW